jgi:hypothetical protein
MDDLFYLTTSKICTFDLYKSIKEMSPEKLLFWEMSNSLQIYYGEDKFIDIYEMSLDDFDCEDREFLIDHKIMAVFCVSHHPEDREFFMKYIEFILVRYGGWLGNDSEKFQPWFNLNNINSFRYYDE